MSEKKVILGEIEEAFEITLPTEVMEALDIDKGDNIQFYQDDDGQILLQKA